MITQEELATARLGTLPESPVNEYANARLGAEAQKVKEEVESQGIRGILNERRAELTDSFERQATGQQNFTETLGQVVGKGVIGTASDVVGYGLTEAAKWVYGQSPKALRDSVSDVAESFGETEAAQLATQAAMFGYKTYTDFKNENPRLAADIEAALNIATLGTLNLVDDVTKAATKKAIDSAATTLEQSASERMLKKALDVVKPDIRLGDRSVREANLRRTESGFFRQKIIPNEEENTAARLLATVMKENDFQSGHFNTAIELANKLGDDLLEDLQILSVRSIDGPNPIVAINPRDALASARTNIRRMIDENQIARGGDPEITRRANQLYAIARSQLERYPATPAGALQARRSFDEIVKRQLNAFNGAMDNADKIFVREIRTSINNAIDEAVPDASVKQKLREQSSLFSVAYTNILPKALEQKGNRLTNALDRLGIHMPSTPLALSATIGAGTGVASTSVGLGLAAGLTGAAAIAAYRSPAARKALARQLRNMEMFLTAQGAKAPILRSFRADRLAVLDLLQETFGDFEEPDNNNNNQQQ